MDNVTLKKLAEIAREQIPELEGRPDLAPRRSDEADFFETSVWSLEAALAAAYELGKKDGTADVQKPVQCKDCEHCSPAGKYDYNESGLVCNIFSGAYEACEIWPEDFCSYGKSNEEAKR